MLINLWVRDKSNGHIHQVGTDVHDSIIFLNGQPCYYNMQNGCGTLDEYEWIEAPDVMRKIVKMNVAMVAMM